ncbi:MAG TPA: protein kinase [Gemmatimonadaceae bacterium]|nr:protein kinase [Gemmatimonadaceae bacterium]
MSDPVLEKLQTALADRYDVEREIGRGGMATVYLARDKGQDRRVAIKVLNADLSVAMGPERFRREIELANQLKHPGILPIYDTGGSDGALYYVMPFVEGESLAARIQRERQLPVDEALRITCEVADAIDYAHKHNIIHRDIKPENILLENGRAVVADFGIARAIVATGDQKLTQTGLALGTPTYMSPEQAMGEKNIDGRSDVYSLGCVLYEMLIGQPPFVGPTAQAIIARQMLDDVPSLTVVRGAIPDDLEDAVFRALSKVPADRFATAGEFAEALNACRESRGQSLGRFERRAQSRRTPRTAGRNRKAPQRGNRKLIFTAVGVALLGALGGAAFWMARSRVATADVGGLPAQNIAVLYFDDVTPRGELRHVANGLTEAVIDELDQVSTLHVISPNGVEPYRNTSLRMDSVARALGVGTIVRGHIEQASADRLRINVRIVDGNTSDQGRAEQFEAPAANLLAIRDTLARKVADLVRGRLGEEVRLREQREGTRNAEAWALRQRAEQLRRDATAKMRANDTTAGLANYRSADSLFAQAEQADPRWIDPIVARGMMALQQVRLTTNQTRQAALVREGQEHAERALALNPRHPGALELRGTLYYVKWRSHLASDPVEVSRLLGQAESDLKSAVGIEKTRATAWATLAAVYSQKPDFIEAALATRRAYEEDAYLTNADAILWSLYATAYDNEQFLDAVKWCAEGERRFPEDPRFVRCRLWLYTTNAAEPNIPQAWSYAERFTQLSPEQTRPFQQREGQMLVAAAIGRAGQTDSAKRVLERARGNPQIDPDRELLTVEALVRTLLKDKDEAFALIKQYLAAKPEHREGLAKSQSWWWRDLKADPRFQEIVGGSG